VSAPAGAAALAELILAASSVVALTGAGISVPSGIPDFRTPGTGIWEHVDPMEVAHIDAWRRDPERFWSFYGQRFQTLGGKRPNGAHDALVALEDRGLLDAVITQNIDMLHRKAGTRELVEVHGSIATSSCSGCGASYDFDAVLGLLADATVPACDCGRTLKPDVVLFGEYLSAEALDRAAELAGGADLLLCIGSSLEVYPVAQRPQLTLAAGGRSPSSRRVPRRWTSEPRSSSTATSRTSCARSSPPCSGSTPSSRRSLPPRPRARPRCWASPPATQARC
jgi:NAD-dependent deacetylase